MFNFVCRQGQSMTRSARFVHGHSLCLDGDPAEMRDIRKLRYVRHVVNWKMSVKCAFWTLNMDYLFKSETQLSILIPMMRFRKVMLIGSILLKSMTVGYVFLMSSYAFIVSDSW